MVQLYTNKIKPKIKILKAENKIFRLEPVKKSCIRVWSLMRYKISPVIFVSK